MIHFFVLLVAGALALSACSRDDGKKALDVVEGACDLRSILKPAELALSDVTDAVDFLCPQLSALRQSGVLPVAPGPEYREACAALRETSASEVLGYWHVCRDELVTLSRQAITAYETAAKEDFPDYKPSKLVLFNSASTLADCGATIVAVSACRNEIYIKPAQFQGYSDPTVMAVYGSGHEVAHVLQSQMGLLADYAQNQAFRELQADCLFGGFSVHLGATPEEVDRAVELLVSIGDLETHGTAEQRKTYALYGLENGAKECLLLKPSSALT